MKAIRNSQSCTAFQGIVEGAKTTEEAWALVEADHLNGSDRRKGFSCGCKLLDSEKGDSLVAYWGSGVYVIKDGALECISWHYDSSD